MSWGCSYLTFHPSIANIQTFQDDFYSLNHFLKILFYFEQTCYATNQAKKNIHEYLFNIHGNENQLSKKSHHKDPHLHTNTCSKNPFNFSPISFIELFLQICFFWEVYKPNWISFTDLFDTQIPCCTASLLKIFIIRQFLSISYKKETFAFSVSTSPRKSFLNPFIH